MGGQSCEPPTHIMLTFDNRTLVQSKNIAANLIKDMSNGTIKCLVDGKPEAFQRAGNIDFVIICVLDKHAEEYGKILTYEFVHCYPDRLVKAGSFSTKNSLSSRGSDQHVYPRGQFADTYILRFQ